MSDIVGNNFQNKICLKSQTDYKSVKIMWLGCLVSEKNPKNMFKRDSFSNFSLKQSYLNKEQS